MYDLFVRKKNKNKYKFCICVINYCGGSMICIIIYLICNLVTSQINLIKNY